MQKIKEYTLAMVGMYGALYILLSIIQIGEFIAEIITKTF